MLTFLPDEILSPPPPSPIWVVGGEQIVNIQNLHVIACAGYVLVYISWQPTNHSRAGGSFMLTTCYVIYLLATSRSFEIFLFFSHFPLYYKTISCGSFLLARFVLVKIQTNNEDVIVSSWFLFIFAISLIKRNLEGTNLPSD